VVDVKSTGHHYIVEELKHNLKQRIKRIRRIKSNIEKYIAELSNAISEYEMQCNAVRDCDYNLIEEARKLLNDLISMLNNSKNEGAKDGAGA